MDTLHPLEMLLKRRFTSCLESREHLIICEVIRKKFYLFSSQRLWEAQIQQSFKTTCCYTDLEFINFRRSPNVSMLICFWWQQKVASVAILLLEQSLIMTFQGQSVQSH